LKLVLPKEGGIRIDLEDDIVAACRMSQDGQVTRP
jgi:NAD(P) transhydrogenase subunit alpha